MTLARALHHLLLPLAILATFPAYVASAQGDVDTRRFPKLVRLLMVPEETALLKELRDEKDRLEFQHLFWARRDPSPGTAQNEVEDAVRTAWARADELFSYPNQKGSETGCGQVLALLGRPEEIRGQNTGTRFDNQALAREGGRQAETWVYRDRPGRAFAFTRAELLVAFDSECRFAEGGILDHDLQRAAAANVVRPDIAYHRGPDGHLVPLAAQRGTAVGALDLLTTPRSDFPFAAETKLIMRAPKGEAVVAGLARFPAPAAGKAPPGSVSIAVRASSPTGVTVSASRDSLVAPSADGSFVASWGLSLKPGRYQVTVAGFLPEAAQGSTTVLDVEVPDFGGSALATSPVVLYPDEPPSTTAADPHDPFATMLLGTLRLRPRFGNVFAPKDALMVVATLHGAKPDPATGQAALRSRFTVLKDGKPVARGPEDAFATPDGVASVGPIPLSTYAPGAYVVRLDVTDNVASQTLHQEVPFEIRQP
jgi:GWxTD domain-containing protein